MEAATVKEAPRPLGFGAAGVRQFRLLWTSRRPLLLAVALLAVLVLAGDPWVQDAKARLLVFWPLWLVAVGPIWGFAVFHEEGPSNRLYHWSLPVGRATHTLARVAAGAVWLGVIYAVLILGGVLIGALDGNLWQLGEVRAMGWLNLFTGPLMGYLVVSLLTLASDYPIRWFFGVIFLFPLTLSILDEWLELDQLAEAILKPLTQQDWGFFPVMIGGLGASVARVEQVLAAMRNPEARVSAAGTEVAYWWAATPLWIALLVALAVFVASRHPDTLPRLRRPG